MATIYARQAIVTKYLGPTNHRGSRVKATCEAGSLTMGWSHDLDVAENHSRVAVALATKLGWAGLWTLGALPGNAGYVLVMLAEGTGVEVGP